MSIALITGSAGLIGSEACKCFHAEGLEIVGIDNDMRARFFGPEASTQRTLEKFQSRLPSYRHFAADISDTELSSKPPSKPADRGSVRPCRN